MCVCAALQGYRVAVRGGVAACCYADTLGLVGAPVSCPGFLWDRRAAWLWGSLVGGNGSLGIEVASSSGLARGASAANWPIAVGYSRCVRLAHELGPRRVATASPPSSCAERYAIALAFVAQPGLAICCLMLLPLYPLAAAHASARVAMRCCFDDRRPQTLVMHMAAALLEWHPLLASATACAISAGTCAASLPTASLVGIIRSCFGGVASPLRTRWTMIPAASSARLLAVSASARRARPIWGLGRQPL